jgi:hypothetical protein
MSLPTSLYIVLDLLDRLYPLLTRDLGQLVYWPVDIQAFQSHVVAPEHTFVEKEIPHFRTRSVSTIKLYPPPVHYQTQEVVPCTLPPLSPHGGKHYSHLIGVYSIRNSPHMR